MATRQDDNAPTVGSALRAAREAAGATVEQVSAETRLRATVIRDIEGDSFRSSGGSVYARGHVKSIARALNIDPSLLLDLFPTTEPASGELLQSEPLTTELTSFGGSAFTAATAALVPERSGPRWGLALSAACLALVGIIAVGYANQPAATGRVAVSPIATQSSTPAPSIVQTPDPSAVAAKPVFSGAQLRIRLINGRSWVRVSNSLGKTLFEGTLNSGEFRDFSDPTRLKILLGNAIAVNLNCDGHDSGPGDGTRSVAHFSCTPTGLSAQ